MADFFQIESAFIKSMLSAGVGSLCILGEFEQAGDLSNSQRKKSKRKFCSHSSRTGL